MYEIRTYEIECETEGEVYEDFPNVLEVVQTKYNPKTGLSLFHFQIRVPVHKESVVQIYGRR